MWRKAVSPWRKPAGAIAAAAMMVLLGTSSPLGAQVDSSITTVVAGSVAEVQPRVVRAMIGEGLTITAAAVGSQVVVGEGAENRNMVDVRYTATLLPTDSSSTEVVLTAIATAKARLAGAKVEQRVTSKMKGGGKAWARLERIAQATANP